MIAELFLLSTLVRQRGRLGLFVPSQREGEEGSRGEA